MHELRRNDLIEPELSYQIVGSLYEVYNELGSGHRENVYQRALATVFRKRGVAFREQVSMELTFQQESIGRFFLDFLVEEKVIVELKQGGRFSKSHFDQVTGYLKTYSIPLGILANFTQQGVICKRVLNPEQKKIYS